MDKGATGTVGEAPWILLASGINSQTASVDEGSYTTTTTVTPEETTTSGNAITPTNSNTTTGITTTGNGSNFTGGNSTGTNTGTSYYGTGGGGGASGRPVSAVTGMYFLHPDHLGSITMITDGYGNVVSGGNNGGKSHISYKPYGEIHRTDSSGPDITRFKFTGQEEDKESGLMYYKARYYDAALGRFIQADSVVMPQSTFGMNRYMYTEGSPVNYRDSTGHNKNNPMLGAIIGYAVGGQQGAVVGAYAGSGKTNVGRDMSVWNSSRVKSFWNNTAIQRSAAGAYLSSESGSNPLEGAAIGYFGSNKADRTSHKRRGLANNDLSHVWEDIKNSDLGKFDTKIWHGYTKFYKEIFYERGLSVAISKSDFGRSDLGRGYEQNKGCLLDVGSKVATMLLIPYMGIFGVALERIGEIYIPIAGGCANGASYFGQ